MQAKTNKIHVQLKQQLHIHTYKKRKQTNTRIANNINMSILTIISTPSIQKNLEQDNDDK